MILRNYYPQGEELLDEVGDPQYFYTRDHLGNIRELVKKSDGTIVGRWDYSPFGVREDPIGGAGSVECEFGFTGHFTHDDSDLALTYYRGYLPGLGRWLSPDPIGVAGGINLYGYVGNDPINLVDPNGLNPVEWLADRFVEVVGSDAAENTAHFIQGYGDSLTFGATRQGRKLLNDGNDYTNPCHKAYKWGERTQIATDLATGGSSLLLKGALKAKGKQVARREANDAITGMPQTQHHVNTVIGHALGPGKNAASHFPLGGLSSAIHSGRWNLRLMPKGPRRGIMSDKHYSLHRRAYAAERLALGNSMLVPFRVLNNQRGSDCD